MSVKKNSVSGLDALIDIAAGTATGGATDGLGKGQVYVATIIEDVYGGQEFSASFGEGSPQRPARLYKIKLQEELGNSQTGGELLSSTRADLLDLLPDANQEERSDTANFLLNMLPEGMFMANDTPEFPGKGDEVYATSDGGIEGRYILSLKGGQAKGTASGLLNSFDKPGNSAQKANEALTMKHQFKDENGELVEPKIRKSEMLAYIKQHLVPGAVGLRSDYGSRFHPVLKKAKMHFGVDVSTGRKLGVEIIAPSDGTVTIARFQGEVGDKWKNGNYIKFKHNTGETSVYLHLHTISETLRPVNPAETKKVITDPKDRTQIPESQDTGAPADQRIGEERSGGRMAMTTPLRVKKGTVLGTIGTSGSSTGIHLHWSMGNNEDPYGAIKRWNAKEVG